MDVVHIILSCMVLLFVGWRTVMDKRSYQKFKDYKTTADRQKLFKLWIVESFLVFAGLTLLIIIATGSQYKDVLSAANDLQKVADLKSVLSEGGSAVIGFISALLVGFIIGIYFQVKQTAGKEAPVAGDIEAILPKNKSELKLTTLLSVNAGVVEELFFRFALATLLFAATGNVVAAILVAVIVFGLVHWYQGWIGVLFTTLLGSFLMTVYLTTGNLFLVISLHVLLDLRSLAFVPYLQMRVAKN